MKIVAPPPPLLALNQQYATAPLDRDLKFNLPCNC